MEPDREQISIVVAEDEYDATNPEYVYDELDVNLTYMYPVEADTGPGTVEPLKGLPGSSVMDEHDDDEHEYTRT